MDIHAEAELRGFDLFEHDYATDEQGLQNGFGELHLRDRFMMR